MGTTTSSSGMASGETFVTIPGSGTWRVNDLQGKTVYSSDGSNIGEINDILISQNGSVNAVIIGVGGFLGMGEKNVAVNINALQMTAGDMTGATGTSAKKGSSASKGADGLPDRIVLNVTRDELEKAPAFKKAASR
jgi:sporulation protein YlmC with PRC-barrel domain